jgi:hypothetical protein
MTQKSPGEVTSIEHDFGEIEIEFECEDPEGGDPEKIKEVFLFSQFPKSVLKKLKIGTKVKSVNHLYLTRS